MRQVMQHWVWTSISALLLISSSSLMAESSPPNETLQPKRPVGVVEMKKQSVPIIVKLPGRAVAYEQADIRPRVDGIIMEKLYKPGVVLEKGAPLFRLDDSSYQATVASDEADVAEAKANLPVKQAAYDRAKKLEGSGYTSDDVDTAKSELASAKATLQSAEAALKYAKIQLGWTTIKAPIKGIAEVADVSVGDLVTSAQDDSLTTVTTLDPIYVDMVAPVSDILSMRHKVSQGTIKVGQKLSAQLLLGNGDVYKGTGMLVASSSTVSTTTGAVSVRFQFDNPDHIILPGMFIRGTLQPGTQMAYLVPQRAGSHGADGKLGIFVVNSEGKTEKVYLETSGSYNNNWIVNSGLSENEKVVVDGQKNLSEGTAVEPVLVTIKDDGTTEDVNAASDTSTTSNAQTSQSEG